MKHTKHKVLLILALVFLLVANLSYFWEQHVGVWLIPITIVLVFTFVFLFVALLLQIFFFIKEKCKTKSRLGLISFLVVVLLVSLLQPFDFETLEGVDLLVANVEGVANCTTTLKLKEGGKFALINVCFGVEKIQGNYSVHGDTISFEYSSKHRYKFATVSAEREGVLKSLFLHQFEAQGKPVKLQIIENKLF